MSITYSEFVSIALGVPHAMRMCSIVICGLSDHYIFPLYFINSKIFERKKVIEHRICVRICSTSLSATFLTIRRTQRDMMKINRGHHVKCQLFFSDFKEI